MSIEWTQRYTLRAWWCEFGDALGGGNWAWLEIPLEAVIEWTYKCTWRPQSCEQGSHNPASLESHLEAVMERVWGWTWRPCSCELGGRNRASLVVHFGGHDRARLDEYLEAVKGQRAGCREYIHQLVHSQTWECEKVTLLLSYHGKLADGGRSCGEATLEAAAAFRGQLSLMRMKGRQTTLGGYCTLCMLYSVYAVFGVNSWSWHGE